MLKRVSHNDNITLLNQGKIWGGKKVNKKKHTCQQVKISCNYFIFYIVKTSSLDKLLLSSSSSSSSSSSLSLSLLLLFLILFSALVLVQEDVIALIEGSHIKKSDTCALSAVTVIPVISLSRDTRPIDECTKSVQMHPGYKTFAHATLDILNTFQWEKIALLYDGKTDITDFILWKNCV